MISGSRYAEPMVTVLRPWQILVATLAGWITLQQDAVIDFLREENRTLKQQLGRRKLRLTDAQRRRLAVRGKAIGRKALAEISSLITPDTILRCTVHRPRGTDRGHGRVRQTTRCDASLLSPRRCVVISRLAL